MMASVQAPSGASLQVAANPLLASFGAASVVRREPPVLDGDRERILQDFVDAT